MTLLSIILSFFPTLIVVSAITSTLWIIISPNTWSIIALLFSLYLLPLLVYRVHGLFYPVKEGITYLQNQEYSPWWGSHQIQLIYIAFPLLETILRLVPGLFSFWIRLWGAKIGQNVYWNPTLEIADRGLVEIGDRAIIGHQVGIYSHAIKPRKENLMLYVKKVKIGSNVFLGSGSRLGPGAIIADGTFIPVTTDLFPNQKAD